MFDFGLPESQENFSSYIVWNHGFLRTGVGSDDCKIRDLAASCSCGVVLTGPLKQILTRVWIC